MQMSGTLSPYVIGSSRREVACVELGLLGFGMSLQTASVEPIVGSCLIKKYHTSAVTRFLPRIDESE